MKNSILIKLFAVLITVLSFQNASALTYKIIAGAGYADSEERQRLGGQVLGGMAIGSTAFYLGGGYNFALDGQLTGNTPKGSTSQLAGFLKIERAISGRSFWGLAVGQAQHTADILNASNVEGSISTDWGMYGAFSLEYKLMKFWVFDIGLGLEYQYYEGKSKTDTIGASTVALDVPDIHMGFVSLVFTENL